MSRTHNETVQSMTCVLSGDDAIIIGVTIHLQKG